MRSEGLEPSTFGAEIRRSIRLNYERKIYILHVNAKRCLCVKGNTLSNNTKIYFMYIRPSAKIYSVPTRG